MKRTWRVLSNSKNYKKNKFLNLSETPVMAKGVSFAKVLTDFLNRPKTIDPPQTLPSVKIDLKTLYSETPVIVWFGHSSYLVHCKGINILVDPVFTGYASPFPGMIKAYPGSNIYKEEDMPEIDVMVITHNHYDHLDKKTLSKLENKTKVFYTPLGVGKDIESCCTHSSEIIELDWWETEDVLPEVNLTATPARHFSGRGLKRGGSLWASFVLKIYGYSIYLGGDSGYDTHFKAIGEKYGPFDIAMLECGQYNKNWPNIHMMPEETVQAAIDLKAKILLPVHWAKFTLAQHPWNEPIKRASAKANQLDLPIATPKIGELVGLDTQHGYEQWWNF